MKNVNQDQNIHYIKCIVKGCTYNNTNLSSLTTKVVIEGTLQIQIVAHGKGQRATLRYSPSLDQGAL